MKNSVVTLRLTTPDIGWDGHAVRVGVNIIEVVFELRVSRNLTVRHARSFARLAHVQDVDPLRPSGRLGGTS